MPARCGRDAYGAAFAYERLMEEAETSTRAGSMFVRPRSSPAGATEERLAAVRLAAETPDTEPSVLALRTVSKRWSGHSRPVLDAVDLKLGAGTATWLGGRNGIGKTTLLRIAAGLIHPDDGTVTLFDQLDPVIDRDEYQRRLGFVSAGYGGLYARLSTRQHLDYWARLALLSPAQRAAAAERAVARFGLGELIDRRVDRLSMGQRQRLRMAGRLLHEPDVVLLDEPRNSLDAEGVAMLKAVLEEVVSRGGAVLWCDPGTESRELAFDGQYILEDGCLLPADSDGTLSGAAASAPPTDVESRASERRNGAR